MHLPKHLYAYDLYTLYVNLNITQKISQVVIFYIQCIILGSSAGAAFWKVYGGGQESTSIVLLSLCRHRQGCRAGEFISQKLGSCHIARATQQRERCLPGNQQASLDLLQQYFADKEVADAIRASLGPKGMGEMIQDRKGDVTITEDGAIILKQM